MWEGHVTIRTFFPASYFMKFMSSSSPALVQLQSSSSPAAGLAHELAHELRSNGSIPLFFYFKYCSLFFVMIFYIVF